MKTILKIGDRRGRLLILNHAPATDRRKRFVCQCDCGKTLAVRSDQLLHRNLSCGCWRKERARAATLRHGQWRTPAYSSWDCMIQRTTNPKCKAFVYYGGRGITVCESWKRFLNFVADMGQPPSDKPTIERIDNDKGYGPDNCRWATRMEQQNNRRGNRLLQVGDKTQTATQWAREVGLLPHTVHSRLHRGWSIERALEVINER